MAMMRVARVTGPGQVRVEGTARPAPGPGEVMVRVLAVGICGSDLQYFAQGRIGDLALPAGHVLGHEVAGVVEALGPGCSHPSPGTLVAVDPAVPCGECRHCLDGNANFCSRLRFFGSPPVHGALCEFVTHPATLVYPLPADVAPGVAAIIEPLGVALHALDLGHVRLGDSVAVFGCGPIGLLVLRAAILAGAGLALVSEPLKHRRELASAWGAESFDPSSQDVVAAMRRRAGEGVDLAIEAAGSPEATRQAVEALRPGGRLVLVGYWKQDDVPFPGIRAMRKGLTVRFVRRMRATFPRAIELALTGRVDLAALISHEFPLTEIATAFAAAEQRAPDVVKVVVRV